MDSVSTMTEQLNWKKLHTAEHHILHVINEYFKAIATSYLHICVQHDPILLSLLLYITSVDCLVSYCQLSNKYCLCHLYVVF